MGKLTTKFRARLPNSPLFQGPADSAALTIPLVCEKSKSFLPGPDTIEPEHQSGQSRSATITTAKPKARQHLRQTREQRRVQRDRRINFVEAVEFAFARDWPINIAITVSWVALIQAGERNEGHCLSRSETARDTYLRTELSRSRPRTADTAPFVAFWVRAIGQDMGAHTHLGLFWATRSGSTDQLIALLERITGSPAAAGTNTDPNVLAESVCKGWQIKPIYGESEKIGAQRWADYLLRHADKHHEIPKGKSFGLSQAIGPAARAKWHNSPPKALPIIEPKTPGQKPALIAERLNI